MSPGPHTWRDRRMGQSGGFHGAKVALFAPGGLVVIRRDDCASIPWPGRVDLPGGGRDGDETPVETIRRETREELGLDLAEHRFFFERSYLSDNNTVWLFGATIARDEVAEIRFGEEGQGWWIDPVATYLARTDAIPHHQARLPEVIAEFDQIS